MTQEEARELARSSDPYIRDSYKVISQGAEFKTIAGDSECEAVLSPSQIEELKGIAFDRVKANYLEHMGSFETPQEAHDSILLRIAGDTLSNPVSQIGTLSDPSVYTHSNVPIMMGPYEGSSIYAPGGLPATIVDKKAVAMVSQGATFKGYEEFWDNDKITELENAAYTTGFNDSIQEAARDAFIYGGSIIYPVFQKDTPASYKRKLNKMNLEPKCITRWVTTDRWNTMIVPSYIVTNKDYLHPKTLFIPQAALDVSTTRMSILKPKPVPYWVALYNIGWAPSDIAGWLRNYYGYEIVSQSIPVMAQQMSLILYRLPLDALNATLGPENVAKLMQVNEENMREWSVLSPKAVNMIGEVEVVNRTYTGLDLLIGSMKSDLAAQCGIPEPALWHTPNKGFSDNTTESLLKQSETLQLYQGFLERCMGPCTEALIAHVWGAGSEEWNHRDTLRMSFNKPVVSTEKDLADVGAKFAASISSFCQAGVSPDTALELSKQFFPSVKVTDEMLKMAKESYDKVMDQAAQGGGGGGMMPGTQAQPKLSPAKAVGNATKGGASGK